jgi:hypothetical protein
MGGMWLRFVSFHIRNLCLTAFKAWCAMSPPVLVHNGTHFSLVSRNLVSDLMISWRSSDSVPHGRFMLSTVFTPIRKSVICNGSVILYQ